MNQEGDVPNVRNFMEFLNAIEDFATIIFYHFSREKISRFVVCGFGVFYTSDFTI